MVPLSTRDLSLFSDWFKVGFLERGGGKWWENISTDPYWWKPFKAQTPFLLFANGFLAVIRIVKKYYEFYTNYPTPPSARNPNYRGSWCITLTSGQPMYPNVGAKIKCGIALWRQLTHRACPVHVAFSFSTHPTTTTPSLT